MPSLEIGRVYDDVKPDEGQRVLVDRLWPRGISNDDPRVGRWLPEVAPSTDLRTWYDHRADRRELFAERYTDELDEQVGPPAESVRELRAVVAAGDVLLVTATKDLDLSHLPILRDFLSDGS